MIYPRSPIGLVLLLPLLSLAAVRVEAASGTAFVALCCDAPSTAAAFDAASLARTRTLVTGSGGDAFALSPDGQKMFVTVDHRRALQVISTVTGAVLATVPVPVGVSGSPPLELAMSPDGSTVYVFAPQARPNSLLLSVDTRTYAVTRTAALPAVGSLGPLLVSPDGTQLYFEVGYASEYVQVVDAATLAPVKSIPVNEYPSSLATTPTGLIVMTDTNNELLVIDPRSSEVRALPLPAGNQGTPGNVISSPDGRVAYISFATGSLLAVSIDSGATVFEASTGYSPTHFAISRDGASLYSSNRSSDGAWSLAKFDIPTQQPTRTVRQLGPISALALTNDGSTLYALNANNSAIASVDVTSQTVTRVTAGGTGINALAIPPAGTTIWASEYSFGVGGTIEFLDPASGRLKYVTGLSGALAFNPAGTVVYAYGPGRLTAYDLQSLTRIGSVSAGQLTNIDQVIPSPDGTRLYLSASFVSGVTGAGTVLFAPGEILVLDTGTFKYTSAINVPEGMGTLALTPDGATLVFTTNYGRLRLVSTATHQLTGTIHFSPANGLLSGLVLSPDGTKAYATDTVNNLLLVANLGTQAQVASFPVGPYPAPVAITADDSEVWLATLSGVEVVGTTTGAVSSIALPGEPSAIVIAP